jgi:thiol-activated cytolysin
VKATKSSTKTAGSSKATKSSTKTTGSSKATKSSTKTTGAAPQSGAAKKGSAQAGKAKTPSLSIDHYIAGLSYDPLVILSVVPDGTTSALPVKDRQSVGNGVIITTKTQHTLKKNLSEVAILSPAAGVIFPGALVQADQDLMEGRPTPIVLPRAPVTLSIDLPGLSKPSGTATPTSSGVLKFLNAILEEWNRIPASQGYVNAARSFLQVSQAFSSQQVSLELGFKAEWASGSASAQVGVASTTEKSVVVAYYKQVFYTITMDTPASPSSVFSKSLTLKQAQQAFDDAHPPAYVRSVDYGRILMIKMESSKVDTSFNLKAAFRQAAFSGSVDASYKQIIQNSTFTVLAIGGGAATPAKMFNGASEANLKELQEYIARDATYRRDNPGLPIAYTVVFLKDNSFARMGNTTDYTETESVRYNNGFVRLAHAGAYVAKFEVNWVEPDASGAYTVNRRWESGEKTSGYSYQVDLPGDAKGVRIKAWAMTGLVWDPWGEIMNVALDGPDNKTYRATGTTLGRSWDHG